MDLSINSIIQSGIRSKSQLYKRFIYWFCKHYFSCDIHPNNNISNSVEFAHNGLGTVINKDAMIGENVLIQHHVTIGRNDSGVPKICGEAYIGAHAVILGGIVIEKNIKIGAGCVVTKNVPANCTVVGNPMKIIIHGKGNEKE